MYMAPNCAVYLLLALSERQVLQFVGPEARSFGEFHEIRSRVGAGTQDEYDRRQRCALLEDGLETDDRRHHVSLAHHARHVLGDGAVDTVDAETAQQHQPVKAAQFAVRRRKLSRLGRVQVEPLRDNAPKKAKNIIEVIIIVMIVFFFRVLRFMFFSFSSLSFFKVLMSCVCICVLHAWRINDNNNIIMKSHRRTTDIEKSHGDTKVMQKLFQK